MLSLNSSDTTIEENVCNVLVSCDTACNTVCVIWQAEEYLHDKMEESKTELKETVRRIEDEHEKQMNEMDTEHQQAVLDLRESSEDQIGRLTTLYPSTHSLLSSGILVNSQLHA